MGRRDVYINKQGWGNAGCGDGLARLHLGHVDGPDRAVEVDEELSDDGDGWRWRVGRWCFDWAHFGELVHAKASEAMVRSTPLAIICASPNRTPFRHCNVNQYGKICTSVLGRDWTADTSIVTVLQAVYGLMLTPEATDPLDTALALLFFEATGEYEAQILEHTSRHASAKSRDEWKQQMLTDGKQMGGTRDDPICL
eukprot:gene21540-25907_t